MANNTKAHLSQMRQNYFDLDAKINQLKRDRSDLSNEIYLARKEYTRQMNELHNMEEILSNPFELKAILKRAGGGGSGPYTRLDLAKSSDDSWKWENYPVILTDHQEKILRKVLNWTSISSFFAFKGHENFTDSELETISLCGLAVRYY